MPSSCFTLRNQRLSMPDSLQWAIARLYVKPIPEVSRELVTGLRNLWPGKCASSSTDLIFISYLMVLVMRSKRISFIIHTGFIVDKLYLVLYGNIIYIFRIFTSLTLGNYVTGSRRSFAYFFRYQEKNRRLSAK